MNEEQYKRIIRMYDDMVNRAIALFIHQQTNFVAGRMGIKPEEARLIVIEALEHHFAATKKKEKEYGNS